MAPPRTSFVLLGLLVAVEALAQTHSIRVPSDIGEAELAEHRRRQLATLDDLEPFAFFRFDDRLAESGITFRHRVTDDAGRDYKMVHYDHGTGLAVADVDGDGWHDLYFVNQLGASELWKNLGDGRFRDITSAAGVGLADRIGVTASFADYDGDGDADLFVTTVRMGNALFQNDGKGTFTDVSKAAGVDYRGHSSGAVFFDYDRDGRLDLFVTNVGVYTSDRRGRGGYYVGLDGAFAGHLFPERAEASLLYRNLGDGRFADVSKETGLVDRSWSGDAAIADLNEDSYPDLYVLNMQGDNHYWENRGGRSFVDRTAELFPKTPWGAMGIQFLDYDGDGKLDLYVTDMHSDMTELIGFEKEKLKSTTSVLREWGDEHLQGGANNVFGNALYRNRGDGSFEEVSDRLGVETYWPWGASAGDLNADGWEDLFVTASMNYTFRYGINSLLLNDRGRRFHDAEFILGVEPRQSGLVVPWFELDCSGADAEHEHCKIGEQRREGKVTILGTAGSRSSAIFDLDRDGDLDIVTADFNSAPQVLVSDLAEQAPVRSIEVVLRGTTSNRDGLGATVVVAAGGRKQTRYVNGKSGYLSQSALPLYFGLGGAERVDHIEVRWPTGITQTVDGAQALVGARVEITEGGAARVLRR
jgi:hypothetical protein